MFLDVDERLPAEILKMALEFGADLAGFVDVESLKRSPSYEMHFKLPIYSLTEDSDNGAALEEVQLTKGKTIWPQEAQAVLIVAICHLKDTPALDYWRHPFFGGTEGNLRLIRINRKIINWLKENRNITGEPIPYAIEQGGFYLKDAAVLAGLGVMGKNNLLITPQFGPRVRLRAMALPVKLPSTGSIDFDPCTSCEMPCRRACPQGAFDEKVYSSSDYGETELPAREGVYARTTCKLEMNKNRAEANFIPIEGKDETMRVVACCRVCEFACPVGGRK